MKCSSNVIRAVYSWQADRARGRLLCMRKQATVPAVLGTTFGRLTVIGQPVAGPDGNYLPCQCSCGVPVFVLWRRLSAGDRTRCGDHCKKNVKSSPLYNAYHGAKSRCTNPNDPAYGRYGGRGIEFRWTSFKEFEKWAVAAYQPGLSLDRKDNNGHYEPANCRWATEEQQARNRRSCITIEYQGECKILKEWSEDSRCAISYAGLYRRVTSGWPFGAALTYPSGSRRPNISD